MNDIRSDYSEIRPLHVLQRPSSSESDEHHRVHAAVVAKLAALSFKHTVHKHAIHTLYTEIVRHPPVWCKHTKWASMHLTPPWVHTCLQESIASICIAGFCAWRLRASTIEIAVPGSVSIVFSDGEWVHDADNAVNVEDKWNIIMVDAPNRHRNGGTTLNSCVANALEDTSIYDEMYENIRRRDHFNSRPAVFTTIDRNLRNQNGSSKQWFQQQTSGATAASRINAVDSNFQTLVENRATAIRRLEQTSNMARERLNTHSTTLAGAKAPLAAKTNHMMHAEHVVTDGKEVHSSRTLMSLTDGFQMLSQTMYNILFHFHVPPQVLGKNINAERTGVNPRLNEMVLQAFFTTTTRFRHQLQCMFDELIVDGACIRFQPTISPYELELLSDKIQPQHLQQLYGTAYHIPASIFKRVITTSSTGKRKRTSEDAPDDTPSGD